MPLKIGHDPELWRYSSVQEAIQKGIDPISTLIRHGQELLAAESAETDDDNLTQLAAR